MRVERGDRVRVVRGRKVPRGTEGKCFWVGEGKAFAWHHVRNGAPLRVGFTTNDGETVWTALSNVEAVLPEEVVAAQEAAFEGLGLA